MSPVLAPERPLVGTRVVDLSRLLPGPACTWYLQGLGAQVTRVEDPLGGDWARLMPPYTPQGVGAWYASINAGKASIAVDLRTDAGRGQLHDLLGSADVLVEGFRPGVMARMDMAPTDLCTQHPRLVVASLSGFGQNGPLRDLPGHDLGYAALTGALALGARHNGIPDPPALQLADLAGGALTAALRIVAALHARTRTGQGCWLDVSLTDGMLALMAPNLTAAAVGSPPRPGAEPLTGGLPTYRIYRCADDGLVAVAALEEKFQRALSSGLQRVLERPVALTVDQLAVAFEERPRDLWASELADACVTPVLEPLEVLRYPLHRARGMVVGEGSSTRVCSPFPGSDQEALQSLPEPGQPTAERIGPLLEVE